LVYDERKLAFAKITYVGTYMYMSSIPINQKAEAGLQLV